MSCPPWRENLYAETGPCRSYFVFGMEVPNFAPDPHAGPYCSVYSDLPQLASLLLVAKKWRTERSWLWEVADRPSLMKNYQVLDENLCWLWVCTVAFAGSRWGYEDRTWMRMREDSSLLVGCCMSTLFYYAFSTSEIKQSTISLLLSFRDCHWLYPCINPYIRRSLLKIMIVLIILSQQYLPFVKDRLLPILYWGLKKDLIGGQQLYIQAIR